MRKLLAVLIAAMFAAVTTGSFAASHMGAAKDDKGMAKKEEMKKDDKASDKGMAKKEEMKKDDKASAKGAKKDEMKKGQKAAAKKEEPKKEEPKK